MDHKSCHYLLETLSEFINDDLGEELCAEIERHMADCENCRIVVDTLRKTVNLYRATQETVAMPNDVRERLYHRLDLDTFLK